MSAVESGEAAQRRGLWLLAALTAVYFGFIGFFSPYLPLWLQELGFGTFAIGVLVSVQSVTRVLAPYAWGWLADRTGHRERLMRVAATGALAAAALLLLVPAGWSPGLWALGAVLFAMFLHTSAMMPMAEASVAQRVTGVDGLDVRRYGRVRVWGSVGFIVTVVVFGLWFEAYGMAAFPAFTVLLLGLLAAVCWRLPSGQTERAETQAAAPALWPILRQPAVAWLFVSVFFMVLSHIALYAFFSLYLTDLGYSKRVVGGLWAVSVFIEILWFIFQGRWLSRPRLPAWLVVVCGVAALRFAATAGLGSHMGVLLVAQASHALTFAAHHTVCIALVNHHFADRLRGRGQALYATIGYGLPGVIGGVGGGALSVHWGLSSVFWAASLSAVAATAAAVQVWRLMRRGNPAPGA